MGCHMNLMRLDEESYKGGQIWLFRYSTRTYTPV